MSNIRHAHVVRGKWKRGKWKKEGRARMADEKNEADNAVGVDEEAQASEDQASGDASAETAAVDPADAAPDADALEGQVAELKDQLLRNLAEVENVKRRAARDVENAHKFAVEKLINDLFPVIDSLEKAIETANVEGAEAIAEGVSLSMKLFVDTLSKSGWSRSTPSVSRSIPISTKP